ncbi:MAG: hypothetical protein CMH54_15410 [Myxococcales bacterium]|nr:hypothetical protein [Myxococcales bacterium]|tara:strand:+ start:1729 stop:2829 length:1101 start_codon:yes stop_codon:yes gene_type:complete
MTPETIKEALRGIKDPDLDRVLASFDGIQDIKVSDGNVSCRIVQAIPLSSQRDALKQTVTDALSSLDGVNKVDVTMDFQVQVSKSPQGDNNRIPGVKNIIAVGSGKGGVGKSTVAINLAMVLAQTGAKTGIVDADIYGPSIPTMLGLTGKTPILDQTNRKILPLEAHGLKAMSIGFMLKETDAVVWRGPMLGKALQQFLEDVIWGELDYLVVDLPPGTGDVQLSLAQLIPVSGAVVVTTPQDVAHADVGRAIKMFEMLNTPILGLVENMSYFVCPDNDKTYHIFGEGRTSEFAESIGIDPLGQLPIDLAVAPSGDAGVPITAASPDGEQGKRYKQIAEKTVVKLAQMAIEKSQDQRAKDFFNIRAT